MLVVLRLGAPSFMITPGSVLCGGASGGRGVSLGLSSIACLLEVNYAQTETKVKPLTRGGYADFIRRIRIELNLDPNTGQSLK